ncbi:MAG: aldehyde dehydrogenase family protein, partial [Noviherbaspirillum sp.]
MPSHYVNGKWIAGEGPRLTAYDPSTGACTWSGSAATAAEVDAACKAARASFDAWAMRASDERIGVCNRFRDLLKEHAEDLARLIALEVGKPLWEARTEVASMAGKIDISVQAYRA